MAVLGSRKATGAGNKREKNVQYHGRHTAQLGLQQSQYLVVVPVPLAAFTAAKRADEANKPRI